MTGYDGSWRIMTADQTGDQTGETDLDQLLHSMQPLLLEGEYVFCSVDSQFNWADCSPVGLFYEAEGLTLILQREQAEAAQLSYMARFRMITLSVHSSLEAVGFLAAIASRLAQAGISVNPVSAYYHDHLFVPSAKAAAAMQILQNWPSELV
jgi:uncharacterized protein